MGTDGVPAVNGRIRADRDAITDSDCGAYHDVLTDGAVSTGIAVTRDMAEMPDTCTHPDPRWHVINQFTAILKLVAESETRVDEHIRELPCRVRVLRNDPLPKLCISFAAPIQDVVRNGGRHRPAVRRALARLTDAAKNRNAVSTGV